MSLDAAAVQSAGKLLKTCLKDTAASFPCKQNISKNEEYDLDSQITLTNIILKSKVRNE